jgi:hypothetical protein
MNAPLALRVLGSASGRREVVSFDKATRLYANADPAVRPELPAYLSAFRYPIHLRRHVEQTGGTAGYTGPIGLAAVNFDLDRPNLDTAVADARRLVAQVADRWHLDADDLVVAFSGSKGFHVSVPATGVDPAPDNHAVARRLSATIAGEVGVIVDESVYLPTQLWRAPNSRHPRSGLYKVRVDADDLLYASADAVRRLAVEPIPYDPPRPSTNPAMLADWSAAARAVREDAEHRAERRRDDAPTGGGKINALTWSFLREGADPGDRHRLLFSASANLAGFTSVDDLVVALLTPAGLDTGLPPREVERQIRCGIDHARRRQQVEGGTP